MKNPPDSSPTLVPIHSIDLGAKMPGFEPEISYVLSVTLSKLLISASVSSSENRDDINTYFIELFED